MQITTDFKDRADYVPASTNPIENAAESWTRLRAEYLDLLNRNRHQETEISRKDARISDLETALLRLQKDRDRAIVTATELKAGLIQAGDIIVSLMRRADAAFRFFRETDIATIVADTVRERADETPRATAAAPERPVEVVPAAQAPSGVSLTAAKLPAPRL